eukprot:TRINITY_DN32829_c0_g1_i1.p1 TRINITY_DN32829_c0_g1~~TRINITY_DN32829_c0_g1_i1.p1  ORF type:complete len:173 (-),score=32.99 TRINITY_DN32829_c0_g1_i1:180-698(-)
MTCSEEALKAEIQASVAAFLAHGDLCDEESDDIQGLTPDTLSTTRSSPLERMLPAGSGDAELINKQTDMSYAQHEFSEWPEESSSDQEPAMHSGSQASSSFKPDNPYAGSALAELPIEYKPCGYWITKGMCKWGTACQFRHDNDKEAFRKYRQLVKRHCRKQLRQNKAANKA